MEATATDTTQTETQEVQTPETPTPEVQAETKSQEQVFDPAKIDPKAKEYFEKTYSEKYKDYEDQKKAAQEWNLVKNDPKFQKWVSTLNQPEAPKPFEISDDQFTQALTDRNAFLKLVNDAAKHLVDQQIGPKLQQTDQHFQLEAKKNELAKTVQKYPDFKDLDKRGLIEPVIRRYPNVSFEDAYWIAKRETWNEDIAKAARGQVQERKTASVEKGNNVNGARRNVVKFESREEALQHVAEEVAAGREAPEIDY